jgi:hypothetical protein
MKNKPDPAPLRPSNLSNEIKKRVPTSGETISLKEPDLDKVMDFMQYDSIFSF